jgi:hypothetical protein
MAFKFAARFYRHCSQCGQRMKRVKLYGHDIYSAAVHYECPCGYHWTYGVYHNSMAPGVPQEDDEQMDAAEFEGQGSGAIR